MLLGVAGAGVTGTVSPHYGAVTNTCVDCHMGDTADHHFEPALATCQRCHPEATSFDYKGVQTEIEDLGHQLGALLLAANLINENSEDGHPTVTSAPEDQGIALYNWLYVMHEDKSMGVHNPDYARALLEEGLSRMGASAAAVH
jgi:formate-dependent nitrite reductase cytochrome c552 subunit